jgi:hypothetical protein
LGAKKHIPVVTYPGSLGDPHIRIKPVTPFVSLLTGNSSKTQEELEAEAHQANLEALSKKIDVLAEYYGAVTDGRVDWRLLAIKLAFAHVPGLTTLEETPRRRGRPGKGIFNFDLYAAVLDILDEGEPSVANACRILCKRPGQWKGANPDSIEARFHESKRRAAALDFRPHLAAPSTSSALDGTPWHELVEAQTKPSDKYPPVPFRMGRIFGLGATALYDHEKSNDK